MKLDTGWSAESSSHTIPPLRGRNPQFRARGFVYSAVVHGCMLTLALYQFKVAKPIVTLISILMMDDFMARQKAAQMFLHHQAMLELIVASDWTWMAGCRQQDIPARINESTTLPCGAFWSRSRSAHTRTGTVARNLVSIGKPPKELAANLTLESLARTAPSGRHRTGDATHRTKPLWAYEILAKSLPTPLTAGG